MKIIEFQKYCADIVSEIDKKYKINRNAQLAMSQMMEEIGELAKEINKKELRGKVSDMKDLESEFADVFLQFSKLADMHGVDIKKAVEAKIIILKERGYLE